MISAWCPYDSNFGRTILFLHVVSLFSKIPSNLLSVERGGRNIWIFLCLCTSHTHTCCIHLSHHVKSTNFLIFLFLGIQVWSESPDSVGHWPFRPVRLWVLVENFEHWSTLGRIACDYLRGVRLPSSYLSNQENYKTFFVVEDLGYISFF